MRPPLLDARLGVVLSGLPRFPRTPSAWWRSGGSCSRTRPRRACQEQPGDGVGGEPAQRHSVPSTRMIQWRARLRLAAFRSASSCRPHARRRPTPDGHTRVIGLHIQAPLPDHLAPRDRRTTVGTTARVATPGGQQTSGSAADSVRCGQPDLPQMV